MKSYVSILFPKCNKNFLVIATISPHEHVLFLYGSEDIKEKILSTFFPSNRTAKPLEADLAKKWSYRKTTAILILWSIPNGKLVTHWMLIALSMILSWDRRFWVWLYGCFKYKSSTRSRLDMGYLIQYRLSVYSVCASMV